MTLSVHLSFSFRAQFFIRIHTALFFSPSFSRLFPHHFSHPLHLRVGFSPIVSVRRCVQSVRIRQKGRRSRGHLSQSDGTAEKYVTRENQFQRRLAPTGLAVKAIVLVPRREGERRTRPFFYAAREEELERRAALIYAILSSVRISCGCGLGVERCFMRRFAAFRQCDRGGASGITSANEFARRFSNERRRVGRAFVQDKNSKYYSPKTLKMYKTELTFFFKL